MLRGGEEWRELARDEHGEHEARRHGQVPGGRPHEPHGERGERQREAEGPDHQRRRQAHRRAHRREQRLRVEIRGELGREALAQLRQRGELADGRLASAQRGSLGARFRPRRFEQELLERHPATFGLGAIEPVQERAFADHVEVVGEGMTGGCRGELAGDLAELAGEAEQTVLVEALAAARVGEPLQHVRVDDQKAHERRQGGEEEAPNPARSVSPDDDADHDDGSDEGGEAGEADARGGPFERLSPGEIVAPALLVLGLGAHCLASTTLRQRGGGCAGPPAPRRRRSPGARAKAWSRVSARVRPRRGARAGPPARGHRRGR